MQANAEELVPTNGSFHIGTIIGRGCDNLVNKTVLDQHPFDVTAETIGNVTAFKLSEAQDFSLKMKIRVEPVHCDA